MNQIAIYYNDNGDVGWMIPSSEWGGTIEELAAKDLAGRPYEKIFKDQLPSDKTFYKAWMIDSGLITINPDKAKAIWKDKWREARKPLLASFDIEFMKAVEAGDSAKQAEIAAQKQALRDVTQTEIAGNSPDEIKAVWPQVLGEKP